MCYKKATCFVLAAGLMVLISSCHDNASELQLISTKKFTQFPSASAIEFDNGKLFVFGDDAAYLMVMDSAYKKIDSVVFNTDTSYRISKDIKPDIESAVIISDNGRKILYASGSFSGKHRMVILHFPLDGMHTPSVEDGSLFYRELTRIQEVNIEGLAFADNKFILANRANMTHPTNQLIISEQFINGDSNISSPHIIDLVLGLKSVAGISGLHYVKETDMLLFTASEEETPNAFEDGLIKDSYLGWITGFSKKMKDSAMMPEKLINLTSFDTTFKQQKIESVCLERIENGNLVLYLAADNDNGTSTLFKMKLKL